MATAETEIYLIQAAIASKFGVEINDVDLVMMDDAGILRIQYATIFLAEKYVRKIINSGGT